MWSYKKLLDLGAEELEPFMFFRERPKARGYMWVGAGTLRLNGIEFQMRGHVHLGDEVTEEEVQAHIRIEYIQTQERCYQPGWNCHYTPEHIWLHPGGWFKNKQFEEQLFGVRDEPGLLPRYNHNIATARVEADPRLMEELGFIRLI